MWYRHTTLVRILMKISQRNLSHASKGWQVVENDSWLNFLYFIFNELLTPTLTFDVFLEFLHVHSVAFITGPTVIFNCFHLNGLLSWVKFWVESELDHRKQHKLTYTTQILNFMRRHVDLSLSSSNKCHQVEWKWIWQILETSKTLSKIKLNLV